VVNGVLQITGSTGNDLISLSQSAQTYTLRNGDWSATVTGAYTGLMINGNGGSDSISLDSSVTTSATLRGGAGDDTLVGGGGNDSLFAGAGTNSLTGGMGNDTFVTLGSAADVLWGGGGFDSFWLDNSSSEIVSDLAVDESAGGALHRVGGFLGFNTGSSIVPVSTSLLGQNLADPVSSASYTYRNFATDPLFGPSGPAENDVVQGQAGDCWFLATLSSVAKIDPNRIRQSIVDLGDGTYAVQFGTTTKTFVRVDADLAGASWGLGYAKLGAGNSLWVALMEKALVSYRYTYSAAKYTNIDGGWMSEAYAALGVNSSSIFASSATDWFNQISSALSAGQSVTFATLTSTQGNLVGSHAYTIDHVGYDASGNAYLVLRNPWGMDGYSTTDGVNDGYVTVSLMTAYNSTSGVSRAMV
jgi:hypothetical protein